MRDPREKLQECGRIKRPPLSYSFHDNLFPKFAKYFFHVIYLSLFVFHLIIHLVSWAPAQYHPNASEGGGRNLD